MFGASFEIEGAIVPFAVRWLRAHYSSGGFHNDLM